MRSLLVRACYGGLRTLGIPSLARRRRDAGVIVCYHNVLSPADPPFGDVSLHMPLPTFERQLRWLAANYDIVPLSRFVNRLETGAPLRRVAAITFDDGYAGVFRHAWPLLTDLGLPATTFVIADAPGRIDSFWWDHPTVQLHASAARRREWLIRLRGADPVIRATLAITTTDVVPPACAPAGWREIAAAASSGMTLGVHSATHRSLPVLDDAELQYELATSRELIAGETGASPEFFAYPYGLWDTRVRRAVRAAGYRAAVTLELGLNRADADPWGLRRINVPAGISDAAFEAWTAGVTLGRGDGR